MNEGEERARGKKILDLIRVAVKGLLAVSSRNIEERKETEDIMYDSSAELDHFCLVMEQSFLFGLKESTGFFGGGKLREWWGFIRGLAKMDKMAANTIDTVLNISSAKTPQGRGRAWIRVALIEKKLAEYVHKLTMSPKVGEYYERWSVFRDSELSQMLLGVLELLSVINFSLCLKDFDFDSISLDQTLSSLQTSALSTNSKRELQFQSILSGFEEVQKDLQSSEQLSKEKVATLLQTVEKLKEEVKLQGEQNEELEGQLVGCGAALEAAKCQRAEVNTELERVKREKDNLDREKNQEIEELAAQLEAKKAVQTQLSSLVKTHTETITKLNQELKDAKSSSGSLLSRLSRGGKNEQSATDIVESLVEENKKEIDTMKATHQQEILEMDRKKELDIAAAKAEKDKEIIDLLKTRPSGDPSLAENLAKIKSEKLNLEREVLRLEQGQIKREEVEKIERKAEREREEVAKKLEEKETAWAREREGMKEEMEREKEKQVVSKQEFAALLKEKENYFSQQLSTEVKTSVEELQQNLEKKKEKYHSQLKVTKEEAAKKEASLQERVQGLEKELFENKQQQTRMKDNLEREWRERERENERKKAEEKETEKEREREEERKRREEERAEVSGLVEEEKKKRQEEEKKRIEDHQHHLSLLSTERQTNSELTTEKQALQQKVTVLEREVMGKEDEIETMKGKIQRAKEDSTSLLEKNKELNETCSDLRKNMRKNEREGGDLKAKLAQIQEEAQNTKESAEHTITRLEAQLSQREESIVKVTSEKARLQECISSLDSGFSQIEEAKKEEIQNKTALLEQLQTQTLHQERTLSEQKSEIAEKTTQIKNISTELESKKKKIVELEEQEEQKREERKEEREREKEMREGLESEVKRKESEQEEVGQKLKRKEDELKELYSAQNTLQKEKNDSKLQLEAQILQISGELKEEKEKNQQSASLSSEWENKHSSLSSSLSSTKTTLREVEKEKKQLEKDLENSKKENNKLSEEMEKQQKSFSVSESALAESKRAVVEKEKEKQQFLEKVSGLESKIHSKKEKLKSAEEKHIQSKTELKNKLSQKERELGEEKEKSGELEKEKQHTQEELKKKEEKISQLENDFTTNKTLLSELKRKNEENEEKIEKFESNLRNLQTELDLEKKMVEVRSTELEQNSSTVASVQKKNDDLSSKNHALVEELKTLKETKQTTTKEREETVGELNKKLEELKKKSEESQSSAKKYQIQVEKLEQILDEKRATVKDLNETIKSLRNLVDTQRESLRSGKGEDFNQIQELEIADLKKQVEIYKKANKSEINAEIQLLLAEMSEKTQKLKEAKEEIELIENYRTQVVGLLQNDVENLLRSSPQALEKWKNIMKICKETFVLVEKEETNKNEFVALKHENEELKEELVALKSVIKEQSFTLSQEKEKTSSSKKLGEELNRLATELKKADEINREKTEQLALMQQIREDNEDLQRRSDAKDAAMRSLAVEHDQLEEEHKQQTSYIEQLKTKVAKNAKTIKQLSLSVHAMGQQLQKGQETTKELEELKEKMSGLMKTIEKVAEISPQVAIEATGATGFKPHSVNVHKIQITDANASEYLHQIESEKKILEEQLADVQLKYIGLCRLVGEGSVAKEEDVSELDAAYNFQMRVEKVRKKERELMQEVNIMAEKESVLTERLKASQLSLRQLKGILESKTRKTDRLKDQMVQLMEENRGYHPTTIKYNEDSDDDEEIEQPRERGENEKQAVLREWLKDEDVTHCLGCHTTFGLLTRKHHCRHCGRIFCDDCSSHQFILHKIHKTQTQRICDDCCTVLSTINGPSKIK